MYRHIYVGCKEEDNDQKNFEALFIAFLLVTIELANDEVIIDLIRLALAIQVQYTPLPKFIVFCIGSDFFVVNNL